MGAAGTRIQKWDNLKFFLIFLVVLGHICDYYTDAYPSMRALFLIIYTFHMPLFIFISGLFCKKNVEQKRYDKIFSYLVLYLLLKIIKFLTFAAVNGNYDFSLFYEGGVPWYVFSLFAFCIITIGLKNVSPLYVMIVSVTLACFAGYDSDVSKLFALSRIIVFYPFFYAGYFLDAEKLLTVLSKKKVKLASAAVLIVFVSVMIFATKSVYWLRPLLSGQNSYDFLKNVRIFGGFYRLLYYVIAFTIGAAVISLTPGRLANGFFAKLGSRSVQVYSLHYIFVALLYEKLNLNRFLEMLIPSHPLWMLVPVSLLIVLICSMKIWTPVFDFILNPKRRETITK